MRLEPVGREQITKACSDSLFRRREMLVARISSRVTETFFVIGPLLSLGDERDQRFKVYRLDRQITGRSERNHAASGTERRAAKRPTRFQQGVGALYRIQRIAS